MNAERLLQLYDRVSEAPDAIPRLRRFILDLAVRGKLVKQDSKEESSLENLSSARRRLEEAAATTKRLRWKPSTHVLPEQTAKSLPPGWVFARVNDTGLYINGLAFKPTDWKQTGLPIIRIQNLTDPAKEFNFAEGEFPDEVIVRDGDLLVSWSATLEAFKWDRGIGVLNQHIFRVIPDEGLTARPFLLLLLRNAIREMAESEHAHGLAMMHINRGPFLDHIVLVPPIAEQYRIVAKFDELMALCDILEAERDKREATRDRLTTASLSRLTAPDVDEKQFKAHADFAIKVLPELTTRPDQIKAMRQTILDLAVRGKLVEQDLDDEPASTLLEMIESWRKEAVARKEIRMPRKEIEAIRAGEGRQDLPIGWVQARLGQLIYVRSGTGLTAEAMVPERIPVFGGNGVTGHHNEANVAEPTVVIGRVGFHCGSIHVTPDKAWITDNAFITHYCREAIHQRYLVLLLMTLPLKEREGATAQPVISGSKIYPIVASLPPLAEQHRIVKKVDELSELCDHLEIELASRQRHQGCMLDALHLTLLGHTMAYVP